VHVTDDSDPGTPAADTVGRRTGWTVAVFIALLTVALLIARRSLRVDFFFDEMWRADMIRASNTRAQYLKHNTALAPGWLYAMRAAIVFEDRRPFLRLLALGCFPLGLTIVWKLLVRMLHTGTRALNSARWLAAWTVLLGVLCRGLANPQPYFNNYGFELLVGAAVVWSCHLCSARYLEAKADAEAEAIRLDRRPHRIAMWTLGCFIVAGPFFVQSALLMWPGACWYFAASCRAQREDFSESTTHSFRRVAAGFMDWRVLTLIAGGGVVGLFTGLAFYKPVAGAGSTEEFWSDVAIKGGPGLGTLVGNFGDALKDSALWTSTPSWPIVWLAGAAGLLGARTVWRAWPGFVWLLVSAQVAAIVFSATTGWPVAPVRVNLGFTFLALVLVPLGALVAVEYLAHRAAAGLPRGQRRQVQTAVLGVVGLAGLVVMWPSSISANAGSTDVFARGLTNDLLTVANDTSGEGLVLSYHVMSHWYTHDLLVNSSWPSRTFRVIRDDGSPTLFDDLNSTLADELGSATDVWCVIPYELGPERALQACRVSDPRLVEVSRVRMKRIELVRFTRTDR
jgi:hypothetical protein